jgi:hypothetical protein
MLDHLPIKLPLSIRDKKAKLPTTRTFIGIVFIGTVVNVMVKDHFFQSESAPTLGAVI